MTLKNAPWFMLFSRIVLFASVQATLALLFLIAGSASAWDKSANRWPLTVAIADIICLFLLIRVFKMEGKAFGSYSVSTASISGVICSPCWS